jgi:CubicO group peptidase (beta-lactamase class C family)
MTLMPRGLLALAVLVGIGEPVSGQVATRLDSVFARFTAPGSPGCALGVLQDGRLSYSRGYGLASVELGVPITPRTVFDIGSVSKQFTAMAVLLLAQDGKLSLDDEIQKYLPEIPRYATSITIRHLLHHTSGLRDYIDILGSSGVQEEMVTTDRDALEALARQKGTNFPPGAEFLYSNSGFFLVSVIVQRASGKSLRDFAVERIFAPLGMSHTQFVERHDRIVPAKAGSYAEAGGGGFRLALANWEQTGDGAVNTTVEDLVAWVGNFSSGRVGGLAAIRELETPGLLNDGKPISYALGLRVSTYRGLRQVSHGGAWAGFRAELDRYPDQGTSVIVLCNLAESDPWLLAARVADVLLGDRMTPSVPEPSPSDRPPRFTPDRAALAGLAGSYHSEELLADWKISVIGDTAYARAGLGSVEPLRPLARDVFSTVGMRVGVVRTAARISGITLNSRGVRNLLLTRLDTGR